MPSQSSLRCVKEIALDDTVTPSSVYFQCWINEETKGMLNDSSTSKVRTETTQFLFVIQIINIFRVNYLINFPTHYSRCSEVYDSNNNESARPVTSFSFHLAPSR